MNKSNLQCEITCVGCGNLENGKERLDLQRVNNVRCYGQNIEWCDHPQGRSEPCNTKGRPQEVGR